MKSTVLTTLLFVIITSCSHKKPEIYSTSSEAIGGYDPVAYFTESKPVKGSQEFSYQWKNANWLFSSKQNLDSFASNPGKFAPQYGGWCAYACSKGHKSTTDPDAWSIVDGKLYLNNSLKVQEMWLSTQKERIEQADKNWPAIKDK